MVLYFNEYGRLLEYLEYGNVARVGTTDFKLFAYFEGMENATLATIRLKRPDLEGSEYPDLFMMPDDFIFNPSVQESAYFKTEDNPYPGFVFDFNNVMNNGNKVRVLDTPGRWEATITVYTNDVDSPANVVGTIEFLVEEAVSAYDEEAEELGVGAVVYNIIELLQSLSVDRFVPYIGATQDLNLGDYKLLVDTLQSHENKDLNLLTGKNIIFVVPYQKNGQTEFMAYKFPAPDVGEIDLSSLDIATRQWVQAWGQESLTFATKAEVDRLFD